VLAGRTSVDEVLRVLDVPIEDPPEKVQAISAQPALVESPAPPIVERRVAEPLPNANATMVPVGGAAFELIDDLLAAEAPQSPGALRVLLVDDEEPLRRSLREVLSDDGFEIFEAADGADALEQVDRHTPDVIVLDLVLPQVDGYEVLRRLRSRPATSNVRVIVLTAHGDEESEVRVFAAGADDFLAKPFRPRALSARIRALAGRP
jgi:CheY-like chemotaxis protein